MIMIKISAFKKLNQGSLATYANNVITLMTENPLFASLSANVAELKTSYDAYVVALANNVNGGRIATIEKDKCKEDVNKLLTKMALLVDILANGKESIVLAAGFDVRKTEITSYTSLKAPNVLKVVNESEAGVVTVELEKVPGATNYGIEKRIVVDGQPEAQWTNGEYFSACKTQITGLESGKTYQLRFRAIGNSKLVSPWSAIADLLVS